MTVLFLIISLILVGGLLIPMLFSDDLLNAVMRFTSDYYTRSKDVWVDEDGGKFKWSPIHDVLSLLRDIYLVCFTLYCKLNIKMWIRDGVMWGKDKMVYKFTLVLVMLGISAIDHLIAQPSGKRKWLILIYLLVPFLWYLQTISPTWWWTGILLLAPISHYYYHQSPDEEDPMKVAIS